MDQSVCTREVVVALQNGLHLTPSSQIAKTANTFGCTISIRKSDRTVDAKSIMDLLTLVAEQGTHLVIEAQGADAAQAVDALVKLFDNNFALDAPQPG